MAAETEGNWRVSVLRLNCQYVTKLPISDTPHLAPNGARRCELFGSHTQTVNHTIMQLSSTFSSIIWSNRRQSGGHLRSNDLRYFPNILPQLPSSRTCGTMARREPPAPEPPSLRYGEPSRRFGASRRRACHAEAMRRRACHAEAMRRREERKELKNPVCAISAISAVK